MNLGHTASRYLLSPARSRYRLQKGRVPNVWLIVFNKDLAEVNLGVKIVMIELGAYLRNLPQGNMRCIPYPSVMRTFALKHSHNHIPHSKPSPLTFSTTRPRPVDPKVSIAKYSPSSIFVWSSVRTNGTDLALFPPCIT